MGESGPGSNIDACSVMHASAVAWVHSARSSCGGKRGGARELVRGGAASFRHRAAVDRHDAWAKRPQAIEATQDEEQALVVAMAMARMVGAREGRSRPRRRRESMSMCRTGNATRGGADRARRARGVLPAGPAAPHPPPLQLHNHVVHYLSCRQSSISSDGGSTAPPPFGRRPGHD